MARAQGGTNGQGPRGDQWPGPNIKSALKTLPDLKILGLTILVSSGPLASMLRSLRDPCEATVQENSRRTSGSPNYPKMLRSPRVPRSPASINIDQIKRTLRDPGKSYV